MRTRALLAAGTALTLAACGVKGPLYLPEKSGAVVTSPTPAPAATPATATPAPSAPAAPAAPAPQKKDAEDKDSQTPQ